jgi:hypothetical protein
MNRIIAPVQPGDQPGQPPPARRPAMRTGTGILLETSAGSRVDGQPVSEQALHTGDRFQNGRAGAVGRSSSAAGAVSSVVVALSGA